MITITDDMWETAERLATSAGLFHERRGCCLWAWREQGAKQYGHRYIDVMGLLDSPHPQHYALHCYTGGVG